MIRGLVVIMAALAVGLLLASFLPFGVPSAVVGILVLLSFMHFSPRYHSDLDRAAAPLLRFLPLFFIPAGVGIMKYTDILTREWLVLGTAIFASTLLGLIVTAIVYNFLTRTEEDPK